MKELETKTEYIVRAKSAMRKVLAEKTLVEKVRSIERMRRAQASAQKAMRVAQVTLENRSRS
jgi:hypothetical protein